MIDDARPMFGFPVAPWHRKFAWLPVDTYDQGWKWLCRIERRRVQKNSGLEGGPGRWWQYRAKREELK
jgi:hypothetical protein